MLILIIIGVSSMDIFKIDQKEYKNLVKEYRNTYIGGKLHLIFDVFSALAFINMISCEVTDMFFDESKSIITDDLVLFGFFLVCTLISYFVYFKYFHFLN